MKNVVFYFHGYGSSSKTNKVSKLQENKNNIVFAFDIDPNPNVSLPYLVECINHVLVEYASMADANIVFVGTSLGAWYAATLAEKYKCASILINPSISPKTSLQKYGDSAKEVSGYYTHTIFDLDLSLAEFHISVNDEVIDFSKYYGELVKHKCFWYENVKHRFDGDEFSNLVKSL